MKEFNQDMMKKFTTTAAIYGFWAGLCIGVGAWAGISYSTHSQATSVAQSIKLGGFVFDTKVYDITERKLNP